MPIESTCTGCGRLLRVADEHAGKQARCPVCQTIYVVPQPMDSPPDDLPDRTFGEMGSAPPPPTNHWYMQTSTGQQFGPVPKDKLDAWVTEGRVDASCRLRSGDDAAWISADAVYPQLSRTRALASANPFSDQYVSPQAPVYLSGAHTLPHRAGVVFVLGMLTWVIQCPFFGIAAWLMGSRDLAEMRSGRMDPSGEGLTQVGRVLGMIHVLLMLVVFLMILFFATAAIVFG